MSLPQVLSQYGYMAVFVGSVLEGETILILAGFAANQGYLSLPLVVAMAFCGGTLGDQIFFFLGRYYGPSLFSRFPRLVSHAQQVSQLIQRHHIGLIVGVRFMYGLRIIGPILLGMSEVSTWRFVSLNFLGAVLWAILISGAGYLFGQTLQWLIADLKQYEEIVVLLIIVVAILIGLVRHFYLGRYGKKRRFF